MLQYFSHKLLCMRGTVVHLTYMLRNDLCTQASLIEELNVLVETNKDLRERMNAMEYVCVCIHVCQYKHLWVFGVCRS